MLNGSACYECGGATKVTETRQGDGAPIMLYRARKCQSCGLVVKTIEIPAPSQCIPVANRRAPARRNRLEQH